LRKKSLTHQVKRQRQNLPAEAGFTPFSPFGAHDGFHVQGESVGEDVVAQSSVLTVPARKQKPMTIDDDHLGRMTLGDRSLEREVLEIFARQTTLTLERIAGAEPSRIGAAAHTLKGSARGIGAWRVADAAERLEQAAANKGDHDAMSAAIAELEAASLEVCAAIGARLAEYLDELSADTFSDRAREH
jgi:HPt (histidine-containing phosphotransfer) domain-containing protein